GAVPPGAYAGGGGGGGSGVAALAERQGDTPSAAVPIRGSRAAAVKAETEARTTASRWTATAARAGALAAAVPAAMAPATEMAAPGGRRRWVAPRSAAAA